MLDSEPLAAATGTEVCRRRSDAFDRAIRALADGVLSESMALLAIGGYGRREMCPGSDVDLLFLHDPRKLIEAAQVERVIYPLYDAGLAVSHAVRTLEQCRTHARADLPTLTSLLDGRLLAGSAALARAAVEVAARIVGDDRPTFLTRLAESRNQRAARHGALGDQLEGDLRDALGGLRDADIVYWLAEPNGGPPRAGPSPDPDGEATGHRDALLRVRTALHRVSGGRSNRLSADLHGAVADALGIGDEPGWEARDVLVRTIAGHARRIDRLAGRALDRAPERSPLTLEAGAVLRILRREDPAQELDSLSATGELRAALWGWANIEGRPQRDPYHRFHVDAHLIRTAGEVSRLLREPSEPFAVEAAASVGDRTPLLLGAILHDIGKVGKGSHVPLGVAIAERALGLLRVDGEARVDALFLVREHLVLADTATRMNLEDEDLILRVAARIGDERRLAMLYLLAVADAEATGPSASTPWRMGLVRELVGKVQRAFERGLMDSDRAERIGEAQHVLRRAMQHLPRDRVERFLRSVPAGYLLWVEPAEADAHVPLVIPRPAEDEIRTHLRPARSAGTARLMAGAVDRLGLLATIAGALTLAGLSIVSAQAFTTEDGLALDAFDVKGAFEPEVGPDRWERFHEVIGGAVRREIDLERQIRTRRAHYRPVGGGTPVSVKVDRDVSDFWTLVEVGGPDRMGLLFDIAWTLSALGLDVHSAKVATYGPRVVDVFYVTEATGQKVQAERASEVKAALEQALTDR